MSVGVPWTSSFVFNVVVVVFGSRTSPRSRPYTRPSLLRICADLSENSLTWVVQVSGPRLFNLVEVVG